MKKVNTYKILILCICCIFFFLAVVSAFVAFQNHLQKNLYATLIDGVDKSIHRSKEHCELVVNDTRGMLTALEALNPNGFADEWKMTIQEGHIHIDYIKSSEVSNILSSNASDSTKGILEKLATGEEVTTAIAAPYFTNSDASFALLRPVIVNGSLTGILRADIDVSLMIDNEYSSSLLQNIYTIIADSDGNIIYSNTNYSSIDELFSSESFNQIHVNMDVISEGFKEEKGTLDINGVEHKCYMAMETLSFNDWKIANVSRSPDVVYESEKILSTMVIIGIFLIVLTIVFCLILIPVLFRKKQEFDTSQRRYDTLS